MTSSRLPTLLAGLLLASCSGEVSPTNDDLDAARDSGPDANRDASDGSGADAATDAAGDAADGSSEPERDASDDSVDQGDASDVTPGFDCIDPAAAVAPPPEPPRHTPRWAFEPWISKDISDRDDTIAFVDGFLSRGIPVGVVVLDSPWETHYNTFIPSPSRYGDFEGLVAELRDVDVRVVLWVTQMVNSSSFDFEMGGDTYLGASPNFAEGQACGYFVEQGRTFSWWKGIGAGVDFLNPAALQWWHAQQDALLDLGVAGWKLDFGDSYITADPVETYAGDVPHQQYSEAYYRDFLAYGVQRRGVDEFVTMVRPWDRSYQFDGRFFARPEHAPVAWVGDNRRDWVGLVDALEHTFRSAEAGYVVIGSDIGGYLDRDDENITTLIPADERVFFAWTAVSAFMPFFQLHGRANLEPWNFGSNPDQTVETYRYWATLHHELVPFFDSIAREAYRGRAAMIDPIGDTPAEWVAGWEFTVGNTFLVLPVYADEMYLYDGQEVAVPAGRWCDFWRPADCVTGPANWTNPPGGVGAATYVFVRAGSIFPFETGSDVIGSVGPAAGARLPAGALGLAITPDPDGGATTFPVWEAGADAPIEVSAEFGAEVAVTLGDFDRDVWLRVAAATGNVLVDDAAAIELPSVEAAGGSGVQWFFDGTDYTYVRIPPGAGSVIRLQPLTE